jgi:tetrahydromethanopterin S-methyltransferase subunit G
MEELLKRILFKLDNMGQRFEQRFNKVDKRFDEVDKRFDRIETELGRVW